MSLSFWKSLDTYIAAYWYAEMDGEQPLSSAGDNLTSNATPSPGLQAVSDRHILSVSQHNVDPNKDPGHLRVTYVESGVYTCRVCNVVGCTQENVTVNVPGRHFYRYMLNLLRIHAYGYSSRKCLIVLIILYKASVFYWHYQPNEGIFRARVEMGKTEECIGDFLLRNEPKYSINFIPNLCYMYSLCYFSPQAIHQ